MLYIYILFFSPIHDLPYQIGRMVSTKSGVQGAFFHAINAMGLHLSLSAYFWYRIRIFGIASFTGWWFQPLWKIWKPVGMMKFPIYGQIKQQIKHVSNHQPVIYVTGDRTLGLAPWCTMFTFVVYVPYDYGVQPCRVFHGDFAMFLAEVIGRTGPRCGSHEVSRVIPEPEWWNANT